MTTQQQKAEAFLASHHGDAPLLLANAWDVGSAKVLAALGFPALATTSGGHAGTLGRRDGSVTRDEALEHARAIVGATDLPVSCDFENGFADAPGDVAANIELVIANGPGGRVRRGRQQGPGRTDLRRGTGRRTGCGGGRGRACRRREARAHRASRELPARAP